MKNKLDKRDIDFHNERRTAEITGVGDPVQKPHRFLTPEQYQALISSLTFDYGLLKKKTPRWAKYSWEELTGVSFPSF